MSRFELLRGLTPGMAQWDDACPSDPLNNALGLLRGLTPDMSEGASSG